MARFGGRSSEARALGGFFGIILLIIMPDYATNLKQFTVPGGGRSSEQEVDPLQSLEPFDS
jgi:hypothetical protein